MKYLPLVWASLWRKKTRTILTLLSLIAAFTLFGLLQAVNVLFSSGADFVGANRLITQARVSFTQPLPLSQLTRIEAVPGVSRVAYSQFFGGIYQDERNFFAQFAVDPERLLDTYPEWVLPADQKQAFTNTRTGAIVGRKLAEKYGFKIGDKVPLKSFIFTKKDGSRAWEWDVVGIFDGKDADWAGRTNLMYLNFAHFDEARQFGQGGAGVYIVRVADPNDSERIAKAIDTQFENSPDETKTQTERDWNLGFARQIGDIGLIVGAILGAVFFTILLVTGNTMSQTVRERIPELAVLKTLGFSDGAVTGFVLAESLALCLLGGLLGMLLSLVAAKGLTSVFGGAQVIVKGKVWVQSLVTMAALAFAVGIFPALRARRLQIVDALAGR
ncbi:MAG: ABC transporter permease [Nevskia sp.]